MPDRLPYVLDYARQDFWPLPCDKHKQASIKWKHLEQRPMTAQERHAGWPNRSNRNIALICGRRAGILFLNINVKNGHDGPGTLRHLGWDRIIPPTPTIGTPSGGLALGFKVPDLDLYPFPFNTHVHPTGYEGLEFRGGDDHIQLVPPSRTTEGVYAFVHPWTLERLRADLADLPGAIMQAWVKLDGGAKISRTFGPAIIGTARKAASAPVLTTDLSPSSHSQPKRSQARAAATAQTATPTSTTLTTVLTTGNDRILVDGFDVYERESVEAICQRVDLSVDSLMGTWPFSCRLPGHGPDRDPSATWLKLPSGYYLYKDWHERGTHGLYTVSEVFAALTSRVVQHLPDPSRMAWRLRLMVEEGWLTPEPVRMKPVPDDASDLLRHYCEGFRFLVMCKSCHPKTVPNAATPFARAFASHWCGIPKGSIWALQQEAIRRDLIVFAGIYKGQALYRPGKDE